MASKKIGDLERNLRGKCEEFLRRCNFLGLNVIITCTYRSPEEQDELYEIGRGENNGVVKMVTNVRGGESPHNTWPALAFDVTIIIINCYGKRIEINQNPKSKEWEKVIDIGESLGLICKIENNLHFEDPLWQKIKKGEKHILLT